MGKLITYEGPDKLKQRIAAVLNVTDVYDADGQSVVDEYGIAHVTGGGGGGSVDPTTFVHKDTKAHWDAQVSLVSQAGHIYVYTDKDVVNGVAIPGIKIGDGSAYLIDMPFIDSNEKELTDHIDDTTVHITQEEREFWNEKVRCFLSQGDSENIVFTTS